MGAVWALTVPTMTSAGDTLPARPGDRRRRGARPLVTFYDDATGERVELSVATFDNWVAKTANLLQDGLGARPGSRVGLLLPLHWQTTVWLVACWCAGLVAAPQTPDADIVVACPDRIADAPIRAGVDVVALSLAPLGRPLDAAPPGVLDYAIVVPSYGDRFVPRSLLGRTTRRWRPGHGRSRTPTCSTTTDCDPGIGS